MTAQLPDPSVSTPTDPRQRVADLEQENARLRRDRAEATARESATSEILRVIAISPTNVQSVLDAVAEQAARLCGEAAGGQILIPARLHGMIEALIDAEPVGELALKGFHRAVPAFNITGLRDGASTEADGTT